jgi:hypothetical protein
LYVSGYAATVDCVVSCQLRYWISMYFFSFSRGL